MEKIIYALTFCYEGSDTVIPYARTIAVSEDIDKLREKMTQCVEEDTRVDEEDEYDDTCNYIAKKVCRDSVVLHHKYCTDLYTRYSIQKVEII